MPSEIYDFYSGFEGEPGTELFVDGELRLRTWDGYWQPLFQSARVSETGRWVGLAAHEHGVTGWHAKWLWRAPDLDDVVRGLELFDRESCTDEVRRPHAALDELFKTAQAAGSAVTIGTT